MEEVDSTEISDLLQLFGFDLNYEAKSLPSYEDKNFLIETSGFFNLIFIVSCFSVIGGKYVLKIYNKGASKEFLNFQNLALQYLCKNSVRVPQV